jgi:hypothetical protein
MDNCRKFSHWSDFLGAILVLGISTLTTPLWGIDYFVDARLGSDTQSGRTPDEAWQSLEKVNSTRFTAGDRILLATGARWQGQLHPQGSGEEGRPIVIDRYGAGPLPVIDAAGSVGRGVLHLHNQSHWEISHLELTNHAPSAGDRRGVMISAANAGLIEHIHLKSLFIHHIAGIVGHSLTAKHTGGIGVFIEADDLRDTRYNDLLIENCRIETVDNTGIFTCSTADGPIETTGPNWERRRITRLRIRGNRIRDVAKNAMIIRLADAGLIEHNVCWDTAYRAGTGNTMFTRSSRNTILQFNEGYLNRSKDFDGSMYDADMDSPGCIFQYSYSHDNSHGLFWMCTNRPDADVIVRYNISQNDKGKIFCINYPNTSCYIYNNVVFIPEHLSPVIIDERRDAEKTYYFYNNVIYNLSPTATYYWRNARRHFANNLFFGHHPEGEPGGPGKLTTDPRFKNPGSGKVGLETLDGYQLLADSPCIDSGLDVPGNGGRDWWGHLVPQGSGTDRGANEFKPANPASHAKPAPQ